MLEKRNVSASPNKDNIRVHNSTAIGFNPKKKGMV
jgi:hypothetical protein